MQHEIAHRHDQAGLLGDRNELVGRNHAVHRMAPADERFQTDHLAGQQIHERLVVHVELLQAQAHRAAMPPWRRGA